MFSFLKKLAGKSGKPQTQTSPAHIAVKEASELEFWINVWNRNIVETVLKNNSLKSAGDADFKRLYAKERVRMAEEQLSGILWMAKKPKGYLEGKTVVEIGPGCCCALEVSGARTKIAVEPLAQQYKDNKLLLDGDYGVTYLNQGSERIPLFDNYADVVIASNCLDHVENLEKSVKEIFRILKKGGELFLNLEIDHAPTECEPFALSMEDVKDTFKAFKTVFINTTKDKKDGRVWLRAVYKKP